MKELVLCSILLLGGTIIAAGCIETGESNISPTTTQPPENGSNGSPGPVCEHRGETTVLDYETAYNASFSHTPRSTEVNHSYVNETSRLQFVVYAGPNEGDKPHAFLDIGAENITLQHALNGSSWVVAHVRLQYTNSVPTTPENPHVLVNLSRVLAPQEYWLDVCLEERSPMPAESLRTEHFIERFSVRGQT